MDPAGAVLIAEEGALTAAPLPPPSLLALLCAPPVATTMGSNFVHGWCHGTFFGLTPIIMADDFGCTSAAIAAVSGAAAVWHREQLLADPAAGSRAPARQYHAGGLVCACNTAALAGAARAAAVGVQSAPRPRSSDSCASRILSCSDDVEPHGLDAGARAQNRWHVTPMGRTFSGVLFCAGDVRAHVSSAPRAVRHALPPGNTDGRHSC